MLSPHTPLPNPLESESAARGTEQRECFASSDGKVLIRRRTETKQNIKTGGKAKAFKSQMQLVWIQRACFTRCGFHLQVQNAKREGEDASS